MKKRGVILAVIILLLLVGVFVVTPLLMISRARTLIDQGIPVYPERGAPTDSFYEGIDLLQKACWFPYYGNDAEDYIMVYMSSTSADYVIDYYNLMRKYQDAERQKFYDKRDSVLEGYQGQNLDSLYASLTYTEYPELDMNAPLTESDRLLFCLKWKRYQEQITELNEESPELLVFANEVYAACD